MKNTHLTNHGTAVALPEIILPEVGTTIEYRYQCFQSDGTERTKTATGQVLSLTPHGVNVSRVPETKLQRGETWVHFIDVLGTATSRNHV